MNKIVNEMEKTLKRQMNEEDFLVKAFPRLVYPFSNSKLSISPIFYLDSQN